MVPRPRRGSTPSPTASTTPAPSCPSTAGQHRLGGSVDRVQSEWQTPLAADPHEHLAPARAGEVELRQVERPARLLEHGGADLHSSPWHAALLRLQDAAARSIGMWQRIRWPASTSTSGGSCLLADRADLARAAGVEHASGGGVAALGMSPSSLMRSRPLPSIVGTADSSASVYGWCGPANTTSAAAELHEAPEVEDGDPVGDVAHDAEVVRDEDVRDALLAPAARRAG